MQQLTEQQMVCQKIMFGGFTNAELDGVADALRFARGQLTKQNTRALRAGDVVKFTSNRNGVTYQGTVEKVKLKYVLVATPAGRYNVPANMLEAV
jgi:hypothetical protein